MRIANPVRVLVAAVLAASVTLLVATIAFGGAGARDRGAVHSHAAGGGHHLHAPLELRLDRDPSVVGPAGQEIRGTRGGRMIYTGTVAWEPTLGIDDKGALFYQGAGPDVVVSGNEGRSWANVTPATHLYSLDPMLYMDTRTGRVFTADLTGLACTTVSHSDDVGKSWTTSKACGLTDHQNVFAGPPVSSSTVGYPNIVYLCAIDGGALADASTATSCLKSLDGGLAWLRTGEPAYTTDLQQLPEICDGGTGHGVVDDKGVVYLPRGWCGEPYLAISKDEGASWERIKVANNGMPRTQGGHYEHEAGVAVDGRGNIYYFWTALDRLPYLAVSTDGGQSFSKPIMVGPPGLKEAWGPTIAVGDTGKIALAYIGSTNAPGGKAPTGEGGYYTDDVTWNGYITMSVDALSKRPRFLTASVNPKADPLMRGACGVIRCGVQGDFIDVVIGPDGRPWAAMADGCPFLGDACNSDPGLGFVGTVVGGPKLR